jgi:hypothetical protein
MAEQQTNETLVNQVYSKLQPTTAYSNAPDYTILYANKYAGGGPVDMVPDLKAIFEDPNMPLTYTSLKMQIEKLMEAYEGGPWVMENINGTLHIHNIPISIPSYGYLYKSESGELLSAVIQTNWASGNVSGSISTGVGIDKDISSTVHVTDPVDGYPGDTDWSSMNAVHITIDGVEHRYETFQQWYGKWMTTYFKKNGCWPRTVPVSDVDMTLHPDKYSNITQMISDNELELFNQARRSYNNEINRKVQATKYKNKRTNLVKSYSKYNNTKDPNGLSRENQIGMDQGSASLASAYNEDPDNLHEHILRAINNALKVSSDLDKERYKLLKEIANKVKSGIRISKLTPSEIEILKSTKLKITGVKGSLSNVRTVTDRVLAKTITGGSTIVLKSGPEQAYAASAAKVKKQVSSSETYMGADTFTDKSGKKRHTYKVETTSGVVTSNRTGEVMGSTKSVYYVFTHYIAESNGSFITTIWDYARQFYSRNRGASTSGSAVGNRFTNTSGAAKRKKIELQLQVVGRPNLMANQSLYVGNIGKKYSGIWQIETCIHRLSPSSGYTCSLTLVRSSGYTTGITNTSHSGPLVSGSGPAPKNLPNNAPPSTYKFYCSGAEYNHLQHLWLAAGGKTSPAYEAYVGQIIWRNNYYGDDTGWRDQPWHVQRGISVTNDSNNSENSAENYQTTEESPQSKSLTQTMKVDQATPKRNTRTRVDFNYYKK